MKKSATTVLFLGIFLLQACSGSSGKPLATVDSGPTDTTPFDDSNEKPSPSTVASPSPSPNVACTVFNPQPLVVAYTDIVGNYYAGFGPTSVPLSLGLKINGVAVPFTVTAERGMPSGTLTKTSNYVSNPDKTQTAMYQAQSGTTALQVDIKTTIAPFYQVTCATTFTLQKVTLLAPTLSLQIGESQNPDPVDSGAPAIMHYNSTNSTQCDYFDKDGVLRQSFAANSGDISSGSLSNTSGHPVRIALSVKCWNTIPLVSVTKTIVVTIHPSDNFAMDISKVLFQEVSSKPAGVDDLAYPYKTSFGSIRANTVITKDFYIKNASSTAVTNLILTPFSQSRFLIIPGDCGDSLAAGASCKVTIRFTPNGIGFWNDSLILSFSNGTQTFYKILSVSGWGIGNGSYVLDVDGDGNIRPETDGNLILGYMFGLTSAQLSPFANSAGSRGTGALVISYLDGLAGALDIDLNGQTNPFTDADLVLGFLWGLTNEQLTPFKGMGALRSEAQIRGYLAPLCGQIP